MVEFRNVTDVSTFTGTIQSVENGMDPSAENFMVPVQGLSDRTRYLKDFGDMLFDNRAPIFYSSELSANFASTKNLATLAVDWTELYDKSDAALHLDVSVYPGTVVIAQFQGLQFARDNVTYTDVGAAIRAVNMGTDTVLEHYELTNGWLPEYGDWWQPLPVTMRLVASTTTTYRFVYLYKLSTGSNSLWIANTSSTSPMPAIVTQAFRAWD
jgi:hypothetical protein